MKELKTILAAFQKVDFAQRKAALATVVNVRGSSYRSPGARMLITDDGKWVGSISGGCLEGDALRKARQVMTSNKPLTITYDTREESNQNLGIGLGCNGVIDVLIEPVQPESETILLIEKIVSANKPVALATRTTGNHAGEKFLLDDDGTVLAKFSNDSLNTLTHNELISVFSYHRSETKVIEDETIFMELIQPVVTLIIFGGGFDARPVSALAKTLGWDVQVTDECVSHIAPVFFPTADKLSLCHREFIDRDFVITPFTACVLMSHNYEYDRDVLKKLITSETPYIGILGPRKRFDKMVRELSAQGIRLSPEDTHRIHSPIGLDIGAETPDEIALSILAEIQSRFANRSGGFLKYRSGPIHERKGEQVFKQVYLGSVSMKQSVQLRPA
ncbi:MAG: XdhC family protein [Cyclobacteriaceae bacterium]|nr:XdhC family protein [Cyclobacteriaceae bacterium]